MNILIVNFFFYIFLSGAILFTILGIFAGSGNPAILVDNYLLDENNKPIEEPGIKKRVTLQYFIAAFLDLCFSLIFLKFILSQNNAPREKIVINKVDNNNITSPEIIENKKIKDTNENIISNNDDEINTNSNQGMSENN